MRVSRRALLSLALLAMALSSAPGCGLFKPRSSEKPSTPSVPCSNLRVPSDAEGEILKQYARPGGSSCYSACIDTGFIFHPDPTDSAEALPLTPFVGWNRDVETSVEQRLERAADSVLVSFDSLYAATSHPRQDQEIRFCYYHLYFKAAGDTALVRYQGLADITYRQNLGDNKWRILDWADKRDGSGLSTWGTLRRTYRNF